LRVYRFGYGLEELERRFDRSVSWVSRRLALVELLPEAIQRQVREGKISVNVAMRYVVPAARINAEDCERMAAIFVEHHCDTRQAAELCIAWRKGSAVIRKRILDSPELFFKNAAARGSETTHDRRQRAKPGWQCKSKAG
jgi:ParB family transcriptional regulator, chromosome partitioning protein